MKAEELRIGNWVKFGDFTLMVDSWRIKNCEEDPTAYNPIPLTPEILEKAGFKTTYEGSKELSVKIGGESVVFDLSENGLVYTAGEGIHLSKYITHLHQIQNLVFAITGSELPINL